MAFFVCNISTCALVVCAIAYACMPFEFKILPCGIQGSHTFLNSSHSLYCPYANTNTSRCLLSLHALRRCASMWVCVCTKWGAIEFIANAYGVSKWIRKQNIHESYSSEWQCCCCHCCCSRYCVALSRHIPHSTQHTFLIKLMQLMLFRTCLPMEITYLEYTHGRSPLPLFLLCLPYTKHTLLAVSLPPSFSSRHCYILLSGSEEKMSEQSVSIWILNGGYTNTHTHTP